MRVIFSYLQPEMEEELTRLLRKAHSEERPIEPFNCHILSQLSKMSEIKDTTITEYSGTENVFATDGSYYGKKGGIGIVARNGQEFALAAHHPSSSFDCEVQAIYYACKIADPSQTAITIITDSMSSIKAIQGNKKTNNFVNETRRYKDQIRFLFINSHIDIDRHKEKDKWKAKLNRRADELANEGITTEETISWPYIPKLILSSDRIIYDIDRT